MNAKTTASKGVGIVLIAGLMSLILGSSLIPTPPANAADVLLVSVAIIASPDTICVGQSTRIAWSSADATSTDIDQGIGSVLPYGARDVSPTQTTTYTITGTNSTGGYGVASATVYVTGPCWTPTPTPTWTPTPTPLPNVNCTPSVQSVQSGQWVAFSVYPTFSAGNLTWSAVGGSPSHGTGTSFGTRFHTSSINETRLVTVTNGYSTATCTVFVYGPQPTWTPIPTPVPMLQCSPSYSSAASGERVYMSAWGGDGSYSWSANHGSPDDGRGQNFSTRFTNYGTSGLTRSVTVKSGNQRAICTVYVYASATPTPYPTWTPVPTPTWTPTPVPSGSMLTLSKVGRNRTRGQTAEASSVRARANDTVEFILRIRNSSTGYLTNVTVTDYLPAGLRYAAGTTTLNGYAVGDGITSSGLAIGPLTAGQTATVKFSVTVDAASVPTWGETIIINRAQARADNAVTVAAQMNVTLGQNVTLATASGVQTGPADSLLLSLIVAAFATSGYAMYTRTGVFGRRMALAEIRTVAGRPLDFSR